MQLQSKAVPWQGNSHMQHADRLCALGHTWDKDHMGLHRDSQASLVWFPGEGGMLTLCSPSLHRRTPADGGRLGPFRASFFQTCHTIQPLRQSCCCSIAMCSARLLVLCLSSVLGCLKLICASTSAPALPPHPLTHGGNPFCSIPLPKECCIYHLPLTEKILNSCILLKHFLFSPHFPPRIRGCAANVL